jgi:hypothetical protein
VNNIIPPIADVRLGFPRFGPAAGPACNKRCVRIFLSKNDRFGTMLLSKEYVGYLAREVTKKLISGEFIQTADVNATTERVHAALLNEMGVEDRINDEVRLILETYSDEMRKSGANFQEMFKKVKNELVRKYKAVL